jgi:hypothetical protein
MSFGRKGLKNGVAGSLFPLPWREEAGRRGIFAVCVRPGRAEEHRKEGK